MAKHRRDRYFEVTLLLLGLVAIALLLSDGKGLLAVFIAFAVGFRAAACLLAWRADLWRL
jgi:hypothetical protein